MRVAFVSFEYPPDTGFGGIATYVYQISRAFSAKGIQVHVICATSAETSATQESDGLLVHRLHCNNQESFNQLTPPELLSIHQSTPIDIIEAPEYRAEAMHIKDVLPQPVLIVKLHTPDYLVKQLNNHYFNKRWYRKLKNFFKPYNYKNDKEYLAAVKADYLISPSHSLKNIVAKDWRISENKILHAPYVYVPSKNLLSIPIAGSYKTVLYFGRLETRKGVYNLARAVPAVLKEQPDTQFVFIGADCRGYLRQKSMKGALKKILKAHESNVRFIASVPLTEVPLHLAKAAVCVFPSLWENFPNVCLEAMSAGRGIVASKNGGMQDMLEDIDGGILINPHTVEEISAAIIKLLKDDSLRRKKGAYCREKVSTIYNEKTTNELINLYKKLSK